MSNSKIRTKLKDIGSKVRLRYRARVGRMGIKYAGSEEYVQRTMLLLDVRRVDTNELVTDHIWLKVYKQLRDFNLKEGDEISFEARVKPYGKGYYTETQQIDYSLSYPSKYVIEQRAERELKEGEITSATIPTWNELLEARERKQKELFKNERKIVNE